MSKDKIGAIVVLYNPDVQSTAKALRSLSPQVDGICVVDNTPGADIGASFKNIPNLHYLPLGENRGIAAAQNAGIEYFDSEGYDYVVFSDQDSLAPEHIVEKLYNGYLLLADCGVNVGVVATRNINKQSGELYQAKDQELGHPVEIPADVNITECYAVMSSISMIALPTLRKVGGFDEKLFIDGVDDEWCWRAKYAGNMRTFVIEDAKIYHMVGEHDRHFMGARIAVPSPFRVYFQYRNFIWLWQRKSTPWYWKKKNLIKYIIKFFYYPAMLSPRGKYLRNMLRGIRDGIRG